MVIPQQLGLVGRDLLLKADPEGPSLIFYAALEHGFYRKSDSFRASASTHRVTVSSPRRPFLLGPILICKVILYQGCFICGEDSVVYQDLADLAVEISPVDVLAYGPGATHAAQH